MPGGYSPPAAPAPSRPPARAPRRFGSLFGGLQDRLFGDDDEIDEATGLSKRDLFRASMLEIAGQTAAAKALREEGELRDGRAARDLQGGGAGIRRIEGAGRLGARREPGGGLLISLPRPRVTATRTCTRTGAVMCGLCEREQERDPWEDVDAKVDEMKEAKRLGNAT